MKKTMMKRNLVKSLILSVMVALSLAMVCGGCTYNYGRGGGHHGR